MAELDRQQLVATLLAARDNAEFAAPPSSQDESFDMMEAYAIAHTHVTVLTERGYQPAGRKIGFTNTALWESLGLATPIWGQMYEQTVRHADNNTATFSLQGLVAPRIEPEIVFKLRSALAPENDEPSEILGAIEWFALGFEIVHCHYPEWRFKPADGVADFGLHGALIVGSPQVVQHEQAAHLADQLRDLQAVLARDGETVAEGSGANVLGHPLLALRELNMLLQTQPNSLPLGQGEVVTTGTLTTALPLTAGTTWTARVSGVELPTLTLTLT